MFNHNLLQDAQLEFLVDPVLKNDDINNDGLIDYAEFIASQIRNKAEARDSLRAKSWGVEIYLILFMKMKEIFCTNNLVKEHTNTFRNTYKFIGTNVKLNNMLCMQVGRNIAQTNYIWRFGLAWTG